MFFRTRHARWQPVGTIRELVEVTFGNSGHVMILILGPRNCFIISTFFCHYSNLKLPSSLSLILVMWLVSAFRMPELHEARQSHAQFLRDHNGSQHPHCTVPLVQSQSRFEGLHPVAPEHSTWLGHPSAVHSKPFASYEQSTPLWLSPALAKSTCTCPNSYHKFVFRKNIRKQSQTSRAHWICVARAHGLHSKALCGFCAAKATHFQGAPSSERVALPRHGGSTSRAGPRLPEIQP